MSFAIRQILFDKKIVNTDNYKSVKILQNKKFTLISLQNRAKVIEYLIIENIYEDI